MNNYLLVYYNNRNKKVYNVEFSKSYTKSEVLSWFKKNKEDDDTILNIIRL